MNLLREFPASGFIGAYLRYARRCTDAPDVYHVGCALAALSSVFAPLVEAAPLIELPSHPQAWRKAVRKLPPESPPTPINLWIGLVGPSGTRKSTATGLIDGVLPDPLLPWREFDGKSPERTFEFFRAHPRGLWLPAWDDFLLRLCRPCWAHGEGLLGGLQDGTNMSRALIEGNVRGRYREPVVTTIKDPCLSTLTTSRGPQKKLPEAVRMLTSRVLWIAGEPRLRRSLPPRSSGKGADRVFCMLARLRKWACSRRGSIGIYREAALVAQAWGREHRVAGSRLRSQLLRAATLDALGCRAGHVEPLHVERMIRVLGPAAVAGARIALGGGGE